MIVGVVNLPVRKGKPLFSTEERLGFIDEATAHLRATSASSRSTSSSSSSRAASGRAAIVKGLRAISRLRVRVRDEPAQPPCRRRTSSTLYLMACPQYSFLSSSGVKELATFGGNIDDLVPEPVAGRLKEELAR